MADFNIEVIVSFNIVVRGWSSRSPCTSTLNSTVGRDDSKIWPFTPMMMENGPQVRWTEPRQPGKTEDAYEIGRNCVKDLESGLIGVFEEREVCKYDSWGNDRFVIDLLNRPVVAYWGLNNRSRSTIMTQIVNIWARWTTKTSLFCHLKKSISRELCACFTDLPSGLILSNTLSCRGGVQNYLRRKTGTTLFCPHSVVFTSCWTPQDCDTDVRGNSLTRNCPRHHGASRKLKNAWADRHLSETVLQQKCRGKVLE